MTPSSTPPSRHDLDPASTTTADRDLYRSLSSYTAKGVGVISAVSRGWDFAATVTAYLSVSYDPPTLLVSLYRDGRLAEALEEAGEWALSIVSAEQKDAVQWLAEPGNPLHGLLKPVPHFRPTDGGPVVLSGSLAWYQARTVAVHEAATHLLFVGEVTSMGQAKGPDSRALVRYGSDYRAFQ
ncbi:flavin reductase family protein [Saxibacter everestensis]|uniref:Flavin reductase family protein n=1 Tax=Saxibacter everestensis TaxID=2909229 RepID=A0ABY8QUX4_9MICO|nr:flavin reductase family protein [Brevibacteriaceae bacterium ZFBP1038]